MKHVTINGCGDCPFQNTDAEECTADRFDRVSGPTCIAVWDRENERHPPEECPLWGGGVLVTIQEE